MDPTNAAVEMGMAPDQGNPLAREPLTSPGRCDAFRSLAGISTAIMGLTGFGHAAASPTLDDADRPADHEFLQVGADRKKRRKRGRTGLTGPKGPTGPAVTLSQQEASQPIPDGANANAQANCPPGQLATGGSASINNTACELVSSNVLGASAWSATGKCPVSLTATITVRVICLG